MCITMYFQGGPLDGAVTLDREVTAGERYSLQEMAIIIAGVTSGEQYNVGHRFQIPSLGRLTRTVVRQTDQLPPPPRNNDSFEYEITNRVEDEDLLLVQCRFVGQIPKTAGISQESDVS